LLKDIAQIIINGPDGDVCLVCQGKRQGEGNTNPNAVDPGDEKLRAVLAAAGVVVGPPKEKKAAQEKSPELIAIQPVESFEERIASALNIVKSVPLPNNIKQFKLVNKIIKDLKALLGEHND